MTDFDLFTPDRIKLMRSLAEFGSASAAAADLGVSQPAVSQALGRLERELGHKLFDRAMRRLTLTPEGEAFLVFASAIREIGSNAKRHFANAKTTSRLHLGVVEEFARIRLARVLALFFKEFANVQFVISADSADRLVADYDRGIYDFVITNTQRQTRGHLLRHFGIVWVGRGPIEPVPTPVPLVVAPAPAPMREAALETLRVRGRPWRILFESASLSAREAAVLAGIGISVTSDLLIPDGMLVLDESSGLPPLPVLDLVMLERGPQAKDDEALATMRTVIRSVFDTLSRTGYQPPV